MVACSVRGCLNTSQETDNSPVRPFIHYFAFPTDENIKNIWIKLCQPEISHDATRTIVICSIHFKDGDFYNVSLPNIRNGQKQVLRKNAIPSQFLFNGVSNFQEAIEDYDNEDATDFDIANVKTEQPDNFDNATPTDTTNVENLEIKVDPEVVLNSSAEHEDPNFVVVKEEPLSDVEKDSSKEDFNEAPVSPIVKKKASIPRLITKLMLQSSNYTVHFNNICKYVNSMRNGKYSKSRNISTVLSIRGHFKRMGTGRDRIWSLQDQFIEAWENYEESYKHKNVDRDHLIDSFWIINHGRGKLQKLHYTKDKSVKTSKSPPPVQKPSLTLAAGSTPQKCLMFIPIHCPQAIYSPVVVPKSELLNGNSSLQLKQISNLNNTNNNASVLSQSSTLVANNGGFIIPQASPIIIMNNLPQATVSPERVTPNNSNTKAPPTPILLNDNNTSKNNGKIPLKRLNTAKDKAKVTFSKARSILKYRNIAPFPSLSTFTNDSCETDNTEAVAADSDSDTLYCESGKEMSDMEELLLDDDSNNLNCPLCSYVAPKKSWMKLHFKIHSNKKKINKCKQCGMAFKLKSSLKRHLKAKHTKSS